MRKISGSEIRTETSSPSYWQISIHRAMIASLLCLFPLNFLHSLLKGVRLFTRNEIHPTSPSPLGNRQSQFEDFQCNVIRDKTERERLRIPLKGTN